MTESGIAGPPGRNRIPSIDTMRGVVLIIMALDHVRDMTTHPLDHAYLCADFRVARGRERLSLRRNPVALHRRGCALSGQPGRMACFH